jgi:hypothetical protein
VSTPVHINRVLREHGFLAVRDELGRELLDAGASRAFAVADHQIAHVYVNDRAHVAAVRNVLAEMPGVDTVLDDDGKAAYRIDHERAGDLVAIASRGAWFTYYYWFDDERAPDFARTVDIHRKPGYDPVELLMNPAIRYAAATVGWKLAKKRMGFRTLLDVIPLDASLVKGSHGRADDDGDEVPLFVTRRRELVVAPTIESIDVYSLLLDHLGVRRAG